MYIVLNKLSEYKYILLRIKNITSYNFLLVFKIFESHQCILNDFNSIDYEETISRNKSISTSVYLK